VIAAESELDAAQEANKALAAGPGVVLRHLAVLEARLDKAGPPSLRAVGE
jgi:hypothetical protein